MNYNICYKNEQKYLIENNNWFKILSKSMSIITVIILITWMTISSTGGSVKIIFNNILQQQNIDFNQVQNLCKKVDWNDSS